jgi:hypothetical protein
MDCMFSGEETSNQEHVIPRWMQRRFKLKNQTYTLPNGTTIRYKHAKIPVATEHNNRFSAIEQRISANTASNQEIYLWAFKVHIGLIFKNSSLKIDIRAPSSPNFWTLEGFGREIWLFQKLYAVWSLEGSISPDPFGTVLRMKALTPEPGFDFIHNMQSGTLFFQLGDEAIFVVLYDLGMGATSNIAGQFEYHRQVISALAADLQSDQGFMAQRVWACEAAYFLYRSIRGINFVCTKDAFHGIPPFMRPSIKPGDPSELAQFCRSFGLNLEKFGDGGVGHVYSPLNIHK